MPYAIATGSFAFILLDSVLEVLRGAIHWPAGFPIIRRPLKTISLGTRARNALRAATLSAQTLAGGAAAYLKEFVNFIEPIKAGRENFQPN